VYERLASRIRAVAGLPPHALNNALVEVYDSTYTKMAFHTDQAQDLESGSHIALYSCYSDADAVPTRKLVIRAKTCNASQASQASQANQASQASQTNQTDQSESPVFEIVLLHNMVVVWSLDTNRKFQHKIVKIGSAKTDQADQADQADSQLWLGVTLRTSKTFVKSSVADSGGGGGGCGKTDTDPVATQQWRCELEDKRILAMANPAQRTAYYAMRAQENSLADFVWPDLDFAVSSSDIMPAQF
jgi:hypothetical protein